MPGSEVSLRSDIDETLRRDWIESVRRTKILTKKIRYLKLLWISK